jgi:wobble nucleotide-excising tRNase
MIIKQKLVIEEVNYMVKKITRIKNFGIFSDFKWRDDIPEFSTYNLIYGWNYSGKTTLSRIFQSFELQRMHPDFSIALFEVQTDDNQKYTNADLSAFKQIRVFNSDFIKANLKWHIEDNEIDPIFILGEENIKLQNQLDKAKSLLEQQISETNKITQEIINAEGKIKKLLSQKAGFIKENLQWPDYEKRNLERTIAEMGEKHAAFSLVPDELRKYIADDRASNIFDTISVPSLPVLEFLSLCNETKAILNQKIVAKVIPEVEADPRLSIWIKEGKDLHKNLDKCQFCGNKIGSDLLQKYENHFSKEYDNLMGCIASLENKISRHKEAVNGFPNILPDKARFYQEFQTIYSAHVEALQIAIGAYSSQIEKLSFSLKRKQEKPFSSIPFLVDMPDIPSIKANYKSIQEIAGSHNIKSTEFDNVKKKARKALETHYAAGFIKEVDYYAVHNALRDLYLHQGESQQKSLEFEKTIGEIEPQISDFAKGVEKINEVLFRFFGQKH